MNVAVMAYDCDSTPNLIAFKGASGQAAKFVVYYGAQSEVVIQTGDRERIEFVTK